MPIYDYECKSCGHLDVDRFAKIDEQFLKCPECKGVTERIISMSGVSISMEDAAWIRSVTEVVEKDRSCRASMEFIKNPTRRKYKAWMAAKGLRHVENEHGGPPTAIDRRGIEARQEASEKQVHKAVWDKHRERNTLNVR